MPRFAANLTLMFQEYEFLDRFEAARKAGFEAVEFQFPYDHSPDDLRAALVDSELRLIMHNLPAGDWNGGERGIACRPDRVDEFRRGVETAIAYARRLDCRMLNCIVGLAPAGVDSSQVLQTLQDNLAFAARRLAGYGLGLTIEPINTRDVPGFYLNASRQAMQLIKQVGESNLALQFDIYHMQIMEGDIARSLADCQHHLAHVQLADNPGRHEPGTGEINFPFLFRHLDRIGYRGWIGCEYLPTGATVDSLDWMRPYR